MARFEGHDDSKALHPWSQFFAAGMGGMISQCASILRLLSDTDDFVERQYILWTH